MKWTNTQKEWGVITQIFHWGMLFIIIFQYSLAYTMTRLPNSDSKWALYGWHKQMGFTFFLLVFLRLWWRERNPIPQDSPKTPKWDHVVSKANIWILYTLMFIFPLSGFLMSILGGHPVNYFDLFVFPSLIEGPNLYASFFHSIHIGCAYLLVVFVGLHILGGLFHHFFWKDNVLRRMLPHTGNLVNNHLFKK